MIFRNLIFQAEVIEQRFGAGLVPHHEQQASKWNGEMQHPELWPAYNPNFAPPQASTEGLFQQTQALSLIDVRLSSGVPKTFVDSAQPSNLKSRCAAFVSWRPKCYRGQFSLRFFFPLPHSLPATNLCAQALLHPERDVAMLAWLRTSTASRLLPRAPSDSAQCSSGPLTACPRPQARSRRSRSSMPTTIPTSKLISAFIP